MDATPVMNDYNLEMDRLHDKYILEMRTLRLAVEKYTKYVGIAIVLVVLEIRFFYIFRKGDVKGPIWGLFRVEHLWQDCLHTVQSVIMTFLMGTMCTNVQTNVIGLCYTTAFTSSMPRMNQVMVLALSTVFHAILHCNGYVALDVWFAIFFSAVYNYNTWTFTKVFFSAGLQLILCYEIIDEWEDIVRYILLFFFVCRLSEFVPVVLKCWRVGVCYKNIVFCTCQIILDYCYKLYNAAVFVLQWCGKRNNWFQGMLHVRTASDAVYDEPFDYDPFSVAYDPRHVKTEYSSDDDSSAQSGPTPPPAGPRTRHMYHVGRSPFRGVS